MTRTRILVVDDEADISTVLSVTLRRAGFEVQTAGDGIEAIEAIQREPPDLVIRILVEEIGDDDARLVQHDMAERDAVGEDRAGLVQGMPRRRFGAGLRQCCQFAGGDHFRQHHGGGLQRLDLFLDIGALGAVLDDQHAKRIAGPQDRHAEE